MKQLIEIYEKYLEKAVQVRSKASPFAGIFGMGDDPRKHPCHEMFYEAVQDWMKEFEASQPDAAAALEAVRFILEAPLAHEDNKDVYWFLYAAHGLTMGLISRIGTADCKVLFDWYDHSFPRRNRFPVQQQVWKLLKDRSR